MASTRKSVTAMDILKSDYEYISTYSKKIDELLHGGFRLGLVTEICGNPGSGKSNLCTQLCISAQMKFSVSSENIGHVVYIDTEGSFVPTRLRTMAMSADDHYRNIDRTTITNQQIEDILKNVTYFRCVNIAELLACLVQLKSILSKDRNVRLIILDSLAHPIRSLSTNSHLVRHKYIIRIVNLLQKLAKDLNCAVIIVNHMVAKIDSPSQDAYCAPALGETFGHMSQLRLQLSWKMNQREARLLKSAHLPEGSTFFRITDDGIRDLDENQIFEQSTQGNIFTSQNVFNMGM